jgi:hypothetical protein
MRFTVFLGSREGHDWSARYVRPRRLVSSQRARVNALLRRRQVRSLFVMRLLSVFLSFGWLLGCGRIGFGELDGESSDFSPIDADATVPVPTPYDAGADALASPSACPGESLVPAHWYRFDGLGTSVRDELDGPAGEAVFAEQDGQGGVDIEGEQAYIDLPRMMLSSDHARSTSSWIIWRGGDAEQTLFFVQEPLLGDSVTALSASIELNISQESMRLRYERLLADQEIVASRTIEPGHLTHLATVYDPATLQTILYLDGVEVGRGGMAGSSAEVIDAEHVWLGRGRSDQGGRFQGRLEDLRMFEATLSPCEVRVAFEAGPDADILCNSCK